MNKAVLGVTFFYLLVKPFAKLCQDEIGSEVYKKYGAVHSLTGCSVNHGTSC